MKRWLVAFLPGPHWTRHSTVLAVGLMLLAAPAFGQGFHGTISVLIVDAQGAVVPGTRASLHSQDTGETREQASGPDGLALFPNLLLGHYTLTVEHAGFKTYERANIPVRANRQVDVRVRLEVGSIEESVSVAAESDLVDVRSSQLAGVSFDATAIRDLPIMDPILDGNPIHLAVLAPGVGTQPGGVAGAGGVTGGNRPRQNNFVVDGLDNNDPTLTGPLIGVIQDSVGEFSVLTNQFHAEFGHSTAGQLITTLKSGTNAFRGGAWGYVANRHLNSLDNRARAGAFDDPDFEKPGYDRQRVGLQLGGPIRRDRWFFYGAYEYGNENRRSTSSSSRVLVPSAAGLATLQSLAADPSTGVSPLSIGILEQNVPRAGSVTGSLNVLDEGTGQLVPIEVGPLPPSPGGGSWREHRAYLSTDYQAGHHRLSGRLHYFQARSMWLTDLESFNGGPSPHSWRATASWVWTARPNVFNELRFGYTDYDWSYEVPGLPPPPPGLDVFGLYAIDEMDLYVGPGSSGRSLTRLGQVSSTTTWIEGRHTLKAGVELRRIDASHENLPNANGTHMWSTLDLFARDTLPDYYTERGVGEPVVEESRDAVYVFLQDGWRLTPRLTLDLGLRYEWTDTARNTAWQDLNTFASIFDIRGEVDASGNTIFDSLHPFHQQRLLGHVGESLVFRAPRSDTNNFSPRVGFAWDVSGDGKTSLRGGFAWSQDVIFGNIPVLQLPPQVRAYNDGHLNACRLSPAPAWCAVGGGGLPGGENVCFSTIGYLNGGALLPTHDPAASEDISVARVQTGSYVPDDTAPETLTWTLALQRELARDSMLEVRYVGTHGRKLPIQRWVNAGLLPTGGSAALGIDMPVFRSESDARATDFAGAPTLQDWLSHRTLILFPYGFYSPVVEFAPIGESWYHGGSIAFTKRFSSGWALNAHYTLSKATDWIENELFTSVLNPRRPMNMTDPSLDEGESGLSKRHKLALSWQWDLPSPSGGGLWKELLRDWSWNGVFLFETGQALTMISRTDTNGDWDTTGDRVWENPGSGSGTGTGVDFVCWNGTVSISPTVQGCGGNAGVVGYVAQDPGAQFVNGALGGTIGVGLIATPRGNHIGPGNIATVNTSLYKRIPLGGTASLRLGVQVLNLTNSPSFALGSASAVSDTGSATANPGYMQPRSPQFLDETIFSGGLGHAPFQRVIQLEARIDF